MFSTIKGCFSSKNIQNSRPCSASEELKILADRATVENFNDSRLAGINMDGYGSFQDLYVDLTLKGEVVKLGAVAKCLSYEACGQAPSILNLLREKRLQGENVIVLLMAFINQLSSYFEKSTTRSIEELAWILYDDYKHLSIED